MSIKKEEEDEPNTAAAATRTSGAQQQKVPQGKQLKQPPVWPDETASQWSKWTYGYMRDILRKGAASASDEQQCLTLNDIYAVPPSMEAKQLTADFMSHLKSSIDNDHDDASIFRTLWHVGAPYFKPAAACEALRTVCLVVQPLFTRELLRTLEDHPGEVVRDQPGGYIPVFGTFIVLLIYGFTTHRQQDFAMKGGVAIRAAVSSALYQHSLTLTPSGRSGVTTGEVTNLIATDTQKLFEVSQVVHQIWSCPLAIVLVTSFLLWIMGPITLIGILVLICFAPAMECIVRKMVAARKQRAKLTDERIEIISAMLQGIKVTKLGNYEARFQERIENARDREMKYVRKELLLWGTTLFMTVLSPVLASFFTFVAYVLIYEDRVLDAATTFTVLTLFSALRFPINHFGTLMGKASQAYSAARRVSMFLHREARPVVPLEKELHSHIEDSAVATDDAAVLTVENGTFTVGKSTEHAPAASDQKENDSTSSVPTEGSNCVESGFTLANIDFSLNNDEILAVVGPVGSGKSTLVHALIGEIESANDASRVTSSGKVAYAGQSPFILNTSVRENILFGQEYDRERYEKVLDDCCLRPDLKQIGPAGDMTQIGERGITLSGGQKQRVSLARVAYSKPGIAIFDDPLSALDAETSRAIFDNLFKKTGLLAGTAIVLVTHAAHYLQSVDKILIIHKGRGIFLGTWDDLVEFHPSENDTADVMEVLNSLRSAVQEGESDNDSEKGDCEKQNFKPCSSHKDAITGKDALSFRSQDTDIDSVDNDGKIMKKEDREFGISSFWTWLLWFKAAGGWTFIILQFLFMFGDRVAYIATEWWLARWTSASDGPIEVFGSEMPSQTDGIDAQREYIYVYALILLVSISFTIIRSYWVVLGGARSSKRLFRLMTRHVLRAPMSYFDTTPLGRILNRFTYDVEVLDVRLAQAMSVMLIACSWFVAGVCIMVTILPWILFVLGPVMACYFALQLYYRRSSVDLQRIDAVSRSPIQALIAEGLDGAVTIRVFHQEDAFIRKFWSALDENGSAMINFLTAHRWLGVRLEILGCVVSFCASFLVVSFNEYFQIDAGIVALLIMWASNFTITLNFLMENTNEAEAAITSVERMNAMTTLPQERALETPEDVVLEQDWPKRGVLEFRDVSLRYREGLPLALDGLCFTIQSGKRCGVVGRTGAGKTSLTAALFRLVEIEGGSILLDGIDLSTLGLADVRGRQKGMAIIPQDPVLFAGTVRDCLDPSGASNDEDMLDALIAVRLASTNNSRAMLDDIVEERGANYSVGERQLMCLARAILSKPKILVLDEATASVDGETDAFLQRMLRTNFQQGTTLLTIAHRLNTIMDYDDVLVMDQGKAVEFGPPHELLSSNSGNSIFAELVDATGAESSLVLRNMAKEAYEEKQQNLDR
eukprot:CAMPEP_0196807870 /NCGR_PEP_ID=MMETSP1362-20130617/7854_1 /TAXON_ID=163516 /ORGANISM="Leptocylindrus danicus, Strain CCMP1856" /LENGTH=1401 /DNA_ID=CAMNT_0042181965 /DNA_START=94 /DNA_END=4299 /DNA_ORIENTATION=-